MREAKVRFPDWKAASIAFIGGLLIAPLLRLVPVVGWDWYRAFFQNRAVLYWYPPWTALFTSPFALTMPWQWGLAFANGLTAAAVAVATLREGRARNAWGYVGAVMAIFSMPMLLLFWTGQVDGWGLIGFMLLPWGVPLLLIKPTLGAFALLARRDWFIAGLAFAALTLVLWPSWPLAALTTHVAKDYPDVVGTLGWYKTYWPIGIFGIILFLFTNRKDPFHLMSSGAFLMPYVFPYHFVFLLPVFGRLEHIPQLLLWLVSWTALVPYAFGNEYSLVGYIFPLAVWLALWRKMPSEDTWLSLLGDLWKRALQRLSA